MPGKLHEPNRHSVLVRALGDCEYRDERGRAQRFDDKRVAIADAGDPNHESPLHWSDAVVIEVLNSSARAVAMMRDPLAAPT
jgi:hypothetical protein